MRGYGYLGALRLRINVLECRKHTLGEQEFETDGEVAASDNLGQDRDLVQAGVTRQT
jgi:hypothetical protein